MPRVLVTPHLLIDRPGPYADILREAGFDLVYPARPIVDAASLRKAIEGMDAVLASVEPYTRDVLQSAGIRAIARMGVGYDAIDIPAATAAGVVVTITPGAVEESVAEQTIALLMAVMRNVVARDREVRQANWRRETFPRLAGKTFGFVGLGRIAKRVAARLSGWRLRLVAHDPAADEAFAATHDIRLCSLEELLAEADVVSLHLPATPKTRHLIEAERLALMKPGAVLINTSRGALIDESALVDALKGGHLLGAGLDVFDMEPLPADSALISLDNVVLAPHMGGLDQQSQRDMAQVAAQCLADLYQGRWPEGFVVNSQLRDGWKW